MEKRCTHLVFGACLWLIFEALAQTLMWFIKGQPIDSWMMVVALLCTTALAVAAIVVATLAQWQKELNKGILLAGEICLFTSFLSFFAWNIVILILL